MATTATAERIPPQDLDIEAAVIGAALYAHSSAELALEALQTDDFYKPAHAAIFHALSQLWEDGRGIDIATVSAQLRNDGQGDNVSPSDLTSLMAKAPSSANTATHVDMLASLAAQRRMLSAANEAVTAIYSGRPEHAMVMLDRALDAADRAADTRTFNATDLTGLLEGTPEPPRLITTWLYAGGLTVLQSEPGVGKSWLALWQAAQVMHAGGTVLYFDEEGGAELIADRIRALGIDAGVIAERFRYFPFESRSWDAADVAALGTLIRKLGDNGHRVDLAILDSLPDFLTAAGLDENSNSEVTAFVARVVGTFRQADVATLVLDHLSKPSGHQAGGARSRYSRGAGAKLAKADATIYVETLVEFDRTTSGSLSVWRAKDRRGGLSLPRLGGRPRVVQVDAVGDGSVVIAEVSDIDGDRMSRAAERPTGLMEAISVWASQCLVDSAMNQTAIGEEFPGFRKVTVSRALEELAKFGYLSIRPGGRGAKQFVFNSLYRQTDELVTEEEEVLARTEAMF